MVLGATLSNDYSTFTAFRSLQGLFGTVPQVVGLPIIHDMYDPKGRFTFLQQSSICAYAAPRLAAYDQHLVYS